MIATGGAESNGPYDPCKGCCVDPVARIQSHLRVRQIARHAPSFAVLLLRVQGLLRGSVVMRVEAKGPQEARTQGRLEEEAVNRGVDVV